VVHSLRIPRWSRGRKGGGRVQNHPFPDTNSGCSAVPVGRVRKEIRMDAFFMFVMVFGVGFCFGAAFQKKIGLL
jgi:hypothetical protein